jgi:hypothetical protein
MSSAGWGCDGIRAPTRGTAPFPRSGETSWNATCISRSRRSSRSRRYSSGSRPRPPGRSPPGGPHGPAPRPDGLGACPRVRDGSRTRAEALVALPGADHDASPTATRGRLTLLDITSGLADDSREAEERAAARRLADLRGPVKAARKAIAAVLGTADAMRADWRKEAAFLARFGVTQGQFRRGCRRARARPRARTRQSYSDCP